MFLLKTVICHLLLQLTFSATEAACPEGWVDGSLVDMGCLKFISEQHYSWDDANNYCQNEENAAPLEIHTEEQHHLVKMELKELEVNGEGQHWWWVGATDSGREGQWYWAASLTPVDDFVWSADRSPTTVFNCMILHYTHDYEGYEQPCEHKYYPICQKL